MIQAEIPVGSVSDLKCKRAAASSASSRSLSLSIHSTFAAAAFAVVFFAGAFLATPARAQFSDPNFSVVHTFDYTGAGEGGNPIGNLVEDSHGNLFGVTEAGGSGDCQMLTSSQIGGCGTVYELVNNGGGSYTEETLYNFTGGDDGSNPMGGLAIDGSGDLFGTTADYLSISGPYANGTIFEIPYDSGSYGGLVTLYTFTGCASPTTNCDGGEPSGQLVVDASGNLFGTTVFGGQTVSALFSSCPTTRAALTRRQ